MRVLILRTFAHSLIWEGIRSHCEYDEDVKNNIYKWEPNYNDFKLEDFSYALGIYMAFYYKYGWDKKTKDERIISFLKLEPSFSSNSFVSDDNNGYTIKVHYSFVRKLWSKADKQKMHLIDNAFISAKKYDLINNFGKVPATGLYDPLSFSLDEDEVKKILSNHNIDLTL